MFISEIISISSTLLSTRNRVHWATQKPPPLSLLLLLSCSLDEYIYLVWTSRHIKKMLLPHKKSSQFHDFVCKNVLLQYILARLRAELSLSRWNKFKNLCQRNQKDTTLPTSHKLYSLCLLLPLEKYQKKFSLNWPSSNTDVS